jgi:hypothetical protein
MASLTLPTTAVASVPVPSAGSLAMYEDSLSLAPFVLNSSGNSQPIYLCIANTAATSGINTSETIVAGGKTSNGATANVLANQFIVGSRIRIVLWGVCTSSAANASTFTLRCGSLGTTSDASVATAAVTAFTSGTAIPFQVIFDFTVTSTGTTGGISGYMTVTNNGTTGIAAAATTVVIATTTATLNTTVAGYIELTYKSAATTTTTTFDGGYLEFLGIG